MTHKRAPQRLGIGLTVNGLNSRFTKFSKTALTRTVVAMTVAPGNVASSPSWSRSWCAHALLCGLVARAWTCCAAPWRLAGSQVTLDRGERPGHAVQSLDNNRSLQRTALRTSLLCIFSCTLRVLPLSLSPLSQEYVHPKFSRKNKFFSNFERELGTCKCFARSAMPSPPSFRAT